MIVINFYQDGSKFEMCKGDKNCFYEQKEYMMKVANFWQNYASEPGLGRAAANICGPINRYYVQDEILQFISNSLGKLHPDMSLIFDYKSMYECIQEQWMKLINKALD